MLSDNEKQELFKLFKIDEKKEDEKDQAIEKFTNFAIKEIYQWTVNRKRYMKITDLEADRIAELSQIFFKDKEPTASYIFNKFDISFGRSRYLSMLIKESKVKEYKETAIEELKEALNTEYNNFMTLSADTQKTTEFVDIIMSQRAYHVLLAEIEEFPENKKPYSGLELKSSLLSSTKIVRLSPKILKNIYEEIVGQWRKNDD